MLSEVLNFLDLPPAPPAVVEVGVGIDGDSGTTAAAVTGMLAGDGVDTEQQQVRIRAAVEKHFPSKNTPATELSHIYLQ